MISKPKSALSAALRVFAKGVSSQQPAVLLQSCKKPSVHVTIAITEKEKKDAYHLGYLEYLKKGYIEANEQELLVHEADLKFETIVLNAYIENELAGTLTVVTNEGESLPFHQTFGEKTPLFLQQGKFSEIVRLAISEKYRLNKEVLMSLFNYAFICSKYIRKSQGFVIEVNPRHKKFYEKMIGFESLGVSCDCDRVKGAPADLLWINFEWEDSYRQQYSYFLPKEQQDEVVRECVLRIRSTPDNKNLHLMVEQMCCGDMLTA